jgi:hypothetical protein
MKKIITFLFVLGLLAFSGSSGLFAQASQNVTFQVNLMEWYDLYMANTTITFTDQAPAIQNPPPAVNIASNENPVAVRVFALVLPSDSLRLTATANGNLTKGAGNDIDVNAISWTVASGAGFLAGTLQNGTAVDAGSWTASAFHWHQGGFNFNFARDYQTQEPGTYMATVTYTLSKV